MSNRRAECDPRYWSVYEIVRDLYRLCIECSEFKGSIVWKFEYPNPPELADALDSLDYWGVPFFYTREGDLFNYYVPLYLEIRRAELWRRMFPDSVVRNAPDRRLSKVGPSRQAPASAKD